jgi:hypothetical protein
MIQELIQQLESTWEVDLFYYLKQFRLKMKS